MLNLDLAGRRTRSALVAGIMVGSIGLSSSAQGFFESFFRNIFGGGPPRSGERPQARQPQEAAGHPQHSLKMRQKRRPATSAISASHEAYCVRLCDGRYFPLSKSVAGDASALCAAACPDASTEIFFGNGDITDATAADGRRYRQLPNAFVFRARLIADCSCKKGSLGLSAINIEKDPTLRQGDIVVTQQGPLVFRGQQGQQTPGASFMSAKDYNGIAPALRRYLATLPINDHR